MEYVDFGNTGFKVSKLIYGTLPMGPLQANMDFSLGAELICHAIESGINMIDTAELYGSYPFIKKALNFNREVIIATKTHAVDAKTALEHVERARKALDRDTLDIVHIHGARVKTPFEDRKEVLDVLCKLKQKNVISHVGLSSHFVTAVKEAAGREEISVVHPLINKEGMGIIDGTRNDMLEAIEDCFNNGKAVYAMKALAGGNFISSARDKLSYLLNNKSIHSVAVGMLSKEEIDANVTLFSRQKADIGVWEKLESRKRTVKIMSAFCKGCGSCIEACSGKAISIENEKAQIDEGKCIICGYCAASCPEFIIRVV